MTKEQFLAFSMPYGLKVYHIDGNREEVRICKIVEYMHEEVTIADNENEYYLLTDELLPILHPLSDYEKFDDMLGLIYCNEIFRVIKHCQKIEDLSFWLVNKMIELHIDVFSLIEKGEAIDVNTLDKNPYA